ncbi:MAG: succinate dehydrogenase assembly factor 2 [Gammaproteobacteria bacterium]|nr:succinate dehydrogenase assembly factor 2 [Gammaproteobacteria bacterium]
MDILEELQNSRVKKGPLSRGELRWACRRGMLELDILMGDFFDRHYDELNEHDQQLFQQLLRFPDQDLHAFFLGNEEPQQRELIRVIDIVRAAASA